ncbi:MAG: Eco57I restriction-modification methylase domain-containing protein [Prevotella sp.]|nr:Eco57I restriction-modification methylase domain-containing protein [Prevotella sp.]
MNKRIFIQHISNASFKELFIREMGWDNTKGQTHFDLDIEGVTFQFSQIAVRSGFQVLTCQVEKIPTSSTAKKIDTRLRRQANDYICIFHKPGSEHHLWVVPVKKVEKRDLVLVEYKTAEKAQFLLEKMDNFTFAIDETTTIMDVKERVQGAFIINSDKITSDFYKGFRKEHANFAKFISGIEDNVELKKNRNKQWYASVMLNRLMFCYFIQKKGFLALNNNYLREKLEQVRKEQGKGKFYTFYKGFLISLFHDGLNSPRHNPDFMRKYGRIPYLNGGMFDIHELESRFPNIDIQDEAFISLFTFFDQWHWHLDDRLTASGKDINPDVLGYIFEQYINDRAQMGAYYTKEDITEYIGRNTIVPFLMDATKKADEKPFLADGAVWLFLQQSGDRYIFDAVKKGHDIPIPDDIAIGIDTTKPNLLERRSRWNERTPEKWALPTEIWRETVERLQRYSDIKAKIEHGEICEVNDFITYNLDIRQFVQDFLATTDDHRFVLHFYHALQQITILDPTCGSGAFLFAALNILEPLYETCITRMQDWQASNPNLFKNELQELNVKYRSNIRYFIYKSIILRNLYGVDIMVEATEIAKLRLFLKMVAVVDVDERDSNLGLEPLPDIDFNIRCGNTLVGYATRAELDKDLVEGDMFEKQEFEQKVNDKCLIVAKAFNIFKQVQLTQTPNLETYKQAKKELKNTLKELNDLLNKKMYSQVTAKTYQEWFSSHQPFHWFAEYYDIIQGNGGFDVIIGNPPYVEYNKKVNGVAVSDIYKIHGYRTIECGNLYAYCIERSKTILNINGKYGMIVPISSVTTPRMNKLTNMLSRGIWFSFYDFRPGHLFDGVNLRLCIFVGNIRTNEIYSTKYNRWYSQNRYNLFNLLMYTSSFIKDDSCLKLSHTIESSIYNKIVGNRSRFSLKSKFILYYHDAILYWLRGTDFEPSFEGYLSSHVKTVCFADRKDLSSAICLFNSSLFYWFWTLSSNCRDLGFDMFYKIKPLLYSDKSNRLVNSLMNDFVRNSLIKERNQKLTGIVKYREFYPVKSKPIIDEIDKVLACHYGLTEEELDFIINYDIKYRMGDELNEK